MISDPAQPHLRLRVSQPLNLRTGNGVPGDELFRLSVFCEFCNLVRSGIDRLARQAGISSRSSRQC